METCAIIHVFSGSNLVLLTSQSTTLAITPRLQLIKSWPTNECVDNKTKNDTSQIDIWMEGTGSDQQGSMMLLLGPCDAHSLIDYVKHPISQLGM